MDIAGVQGDTPWSSFFAFYFEETSAALIRSLKYAATIIANSKEHIRPRRKIDMNITMVLVEIDDVCFHDDVPNE
ncbi:MAG: hypothetical protein K9N21_02135 [Deltaproteobacteria bacterium]|nr:hypothetical protein [Deltaproteobacteria bacterium]